IHTMRRPFLSSTVVTVAVVTLARIERRSSVMLMRAPWCGSTRRLARCAGTKGDRVAQALGGGDAVLPPPAHLVAQHVGRARRELQRERFARRRAWRMRIRPKAHATRARERHTHHHRELRHVAMPAQRRPWTIFGDQ